MSQGQLARNRALSMGSGRSSKGKKTALAEFSMAPAEMERDFEPCAATASMFLYAQGNSVVVAHHDTLTIERRFSRHTEQVQLLAVDNVSERGSGRLVITYDVGQTAIVWDLMTGDEIARFASYNNLTVAAWMHNGNVAFGNAQGNVILFEPSTSEHISARTIDQIPITALAPAADCRTYAIGYQNGSLLIATLQPRFQILHNLTTSRSPSPIITLAWHASSSKQKSDMLASQTSDGDLRVWSVAKSPSSNDQAKVVRVLRRNNHENYEPGPNWLGWSKNGRILQFSEGETSSWDVRTKNVTYENVPTLEHVRGLALYGPGATLFTLGPHNTVQQFDLNSPPVLVANVQHPANLLPPSPPVSIEEQQQSAPAQRNLVGLQSVPVSLDSVSESDEDVMSPLARIAREMDRVDVPDRSDALSPVSSQHSYTSRSSTASAPYRQQSSVLSGRTMMSIGSSMHSRDQGSIASRDTRSISSVSSSNISSRSRPGRSSRLRQEVLRSPEEKVVVDLFKFTKSRLSDIPYRHPSVSDNASMTNDQLRRQMLSTIFGWDGEADGLIRDELSRHPLGSPNRLLLTKWLGDIDTDIMAASSESMTASDWMLLALSGIGGQNSQHKVARAYIQRLLEKGDVHTAATIMIGMGDQNDAIEIYVSHKRYMEALILVCHVYPADWGRQTQLIRKWGEWAVQHSQQQLAIRCFSCTGSEPSEQYTSPSATVTTFMQSRTTSNIPEILSPPLSPPGVVPRGPQRNMAKAAALKLVTSFDNPKGKSKFFGVDGDRTPMNAGAGVTPIAESALSPHGGETAHTAFLRPSQRSTFNTPVTARATTPGGYSRQRLPSIGEMPSDVTPQTLRKAANLAAEIDSRHSRKSSQPESLQLGSDIYNPGERAATASPMMQKVQNLRAINPLPAPSADTFTAIKQESRARNGSRDRKPDGLQIQWPPMESIITGDYMTTPELSVTSSRHRTPKAAQSVTGSIASVSSSGRSPLPSERSFRSFQSSSSTGAGYSTLDRYINSVDAAQPALQDSRARQASQDPNERGKRGRSTGRKVKSREPSQDRDRSGIRHIKPAKRSPTSPVPMSPEEFQGALDTMIDARSEKDAKPRAAHRTRGDSQATAIPGSKSSSRIRRQSPEPLRIYTGSRPSSRVSNRITTGRQTSPEPAGALRGEDRGRSKGREGAVLRSPSSPLPMSPEARFYKADIDDDYSTTSKKVRSRATSRARSQSRAREKASSRNVSPERKHRERSVSRSQRGGRTREKGSDEEMRERRAASRGRPVADMKAGDLVTIKTERQLKKETAARELEERRRSLVRRPSAPPIVYPEELSPFVYRPTDGFLSRSTYTANQLPPRSQTADPEASRPQDAVKVQVGLPATPRAMQHPKFDPDSKDIPDVPQIPNSFHAGRSDVQPTIDEDGPLLPSTTFTLLPKTTYQAAPRFVPPPRSMSAPIREPVSPMALPAGLPTHPAFQAALPPSARRRTQDAQNQSRKINPGEAQPGTLGYDAMNNMPQYSPGIVVMGGIDETMEAASHHINPANNNLTPPPPPPPPSPPMLPELRHLAMPPPPPPAPLYRIVSTSNPQSSPPPSTMIEIVMDEDTAPIIPVPPMHHPPPQQQQQQYASNRSSPEKELSNSQSHSRRGSSSLQQPPPISAHNRGRSQNDNTLSGRFGRATERIRSLSRGSSPQLMRNNLPPPPPPISPPMSMSMGVGMGAGMSDGAMQHAAQRQWIMDQANRAAGAVAVTAANGSTPGTASDRRERHPSAVRAEMMEGGMI